MTNTLTSTLDLDRLAVDLDRHDPAVVDRHLATVAALAHEAGLTTASLSVLTDPTTPAVARDRALAVVAGQLRRAGGRRRDVLAAAA